MRRIVLAAGLVLALGIGIGAFALVQGGEGEEAETPLEVANRKLANAGQPTLPPDWNPPPIPSPDPGIRPWTPTPGPSPTPMAPVCSEANITGAEEIVQRYGSATSTECAAVGSFMYFLVPGDREGDRHGGVAVFECSRECVENLADEPGRYVIGRGEAGAWSFYPAPYSISKVMGFSSPDTLILAPAQLCLNLRTGEYNSVQPCFEEPTVPPTPWEVTPYVEPTAVDIGRPPSE
jgi:hypothetical protein